MGSASMRDPFSVSAGAVRAPPPQIQPCRRPEMQYLLRLRRSVGHQQQNRPDDVLRVKTALNQLGHYDVGKHGLGAGADEALVSAISEYQRQRGLKAEDGKSGV